MEEQDGNNRFLEEQLSIWDIQVIEKVSKKSKINNKIGKDDYSKKLQNKIIEKYKEISDLNRIIQYCGGGIGVEFISEGVYRTIYINKEGKEEFQLSKKSIVLPMDKILYYKNLEVPNEFQEKKLKTLKENFNVTKVIRRKGDENILIEVEDKIISIIRKGWILEFYGVQALYDEDEVKNFFLTDDIEDIRESIKVGDIVQAQHGERIITGRICRVYGPGNVTLNIIFDNEGRHTAIYRGCVIKLIKSA